MCVFTHAHLHSCMNTHANPHTREEYYIFEGLHYKFAKSYRVVMQKTITTSNLYSVTSSGLRGSTCYPRRKPPWCSWRRELWNGWTCDLSRSQIPHGACVNASSWGKARAWWAVIFIHYSLSFIFWKFKKNYEAYPRFGWQFSLLEGVH